MTKPIAYSYVRFSSKKQEQGDSVRRQVAATEKFCERHGLQLDRTLKHDLGKSAYHAKHLEEGGSLAVFLSMVESGRVKPGSWLVLESLDRLSRQKPKVALRLLLSIVEQGVTLATTDPERIYTDESTNDILPLMEILMIASRANEESERKSSRVKEARKNSVNVAKATGKIITSRCPAWLEVVNGKFVINEERKTVIEQIFAMAKTMGSRAIAKELNRQRVPTWGGAVAWGWAYVQLILADGRVCGHHICSKTKQVLVPNYYPRIISDELFDEQKCLRNKRKKFSGPIGKCVTNLFQGLMFDKETGSSLVTVRKAKDKPTRLIPSAYETGSTPNAKSFQYDTFEEAFLNYIMRLKVADMMPNKQKQVDRLPSLIAELADAEAQISDLTKALTNRKKPMAAVLDAIEQLEATKAALTSEIEAEKDKTRSSAGDTLETCKTVVELLKTAKGEDLVTARLKIRAAVRRLVKKIDCQIEAQGWTYILEAKIHFHSGVLGSLTIKTVRGKLESVKSGLKPAFDPSWLSKADYAKAKQRS